MSEPINTDQQQDSTVEQPSGAALLSKMSEAVNTLNEANAKLVENAKKVAAHLTDPTAHGAATEANIAKAMPQPVIEGTFLSFRDAEGNVLAEPVNLKGERGAPGEKGDPGEKGEKGDPGQDGMDGANGADGMDGAPGQMPGHQWEGTALQFQNPDGTWGNSVELKGEKGEPGEKGEKGDPGPANGPKGDKPDHKWEGSALSFENPDGSWGESVNLKGEKGEPGEKGEKGEKGEPGADGADGITQEAVSSLISSHNDAADAHGLSTPESPFRSQVIAIAQNEAERAATEAVSNVIVGSIDPVFGIARLKTGGGAGLWFHTDANGDPLNLNTAYFDRHPVYGAIERVLIDGQIMGKIPKFYVKHDTVGAGKSLPEGSRITYLSPTQKDGFHLHPAFLNNNEEIDSFFLGCFKGSMDSTNTKIQSVHGVYPAVSKDFSTFKGLCASRNVGGIEGFMMQDVYQRSAIQLLMLAEFATPDMQAVLGRGHVDASAACTVDATSNHKPWRGFHGLYGNVWEMVDGVRADTNKKLEIFRADGTRAYVATNIAMIPRTAQSWDGWISEMMGDEAEGYCLKDVFIPSAHAGAENCGTYGDAHFGANANGVCYVGGAWGSGSCAGLFCVNFSDVASHLHSTIGVRLAKV